MTDRKLLDEVKNYLDITWDDIDTDKKISGIIARGKLKIIDLVGAFRSDFDKDTLAKSLLMEYCRLAWAGVPEKFEEIFRSELIGLRLKNITEDMSNE